MPTKKSEKIKKAIEDAISSPGNHACRNSPEGICPVSAVVSDDILFVTNKKHLDCPFYVPFGYGGFCNFTPRKELYGEYLV